MLYLSVMENTAVSRRTFQGTLRHVYRHWPTYAALYGGLIAALLLIALGLGQGWSGVAVLGAALFLLLLGLLLVSLWTAHEQFDKADVAPQEMLFAMSQAAPTDELLYIDLGLRRPAIAVGSHLTTGSLTVVDVYNPQLTPGAALKRARGRAANALLDRRLHWYDSSIDLLPLPDVSVSAVFVNQVLSEFAQQGDRETLLREARRVLETNGRLLLAERIKTQSNWLVLGPGALRLEPAAYWRRLLTENGFEIKREETIQGMIHCIRADKPSPYAGKQLKLDLGYW